MCGPATVPITFACTPKWPRASTRPAAVPEAPPQSRRDLSLVGGVGARLLAGRARQEIPGFGQLPREVRVLGDGVAQTPLRGQRAGFRARHAPDLPLEEVRARAAGRVIALVVRCALRQRRSGRRCVVGVLLRWAL